MRWPLSLFSPTYNQNPSPPFITTPRSLAGSLTPAALSHLKQKIRPPQSGNGSLRVVIQLRLDD